MYRFIQLKEVIFSLFEVFLKTPVFSKNGMAHWLQMVPAVKGLKLLSSEDQGLRGFQLTFEQYCNSETFLSQIAPNMQTALYPS